MRRLLVTLALALASAALPAGCVRSGGSDGDLTDDWPVLAAPLPFTPTSGVCMPRTTAVVQASTYETVDCARNHLAEAVTSARSPRGGPSGTS